MEHWRSYPVIVDDSTMGPQRLFAIVEGRQVQVFIDGREVFVASDGTIWQAVDGDHREHRAYSYGDDPVDTDLVLAYGDPADLGLVFVDGSALTWREGERADRWDDRQDGSAGGADDGQGWDIAEAAPGPMGAAKAWVVEPVTGRLTVTEGAVVVPVVVPIRDEWEGGWQVTEVSVADDGTLWTLHEVNAHRWKAYRRGEPVFLEQVHTGALTSTEDGQLWMDEELTWVPAIEGQSMPWDQEDIDTQESPEAPTVTAGLLTSIVGRHEPLSSRIAAAATLIEAGTADEEFEIQIRKDAVDSGTTWLGPLYPMLSCGFIIQERGGQQRYVMLRHNVEAQGNPPKIVIKSLTAQNNTANRVPAINLPEAWVGYFAEKLAAVEGVDAKIAFVADCCSFLREKNFPPLDIYSLTNAIKAERLVALLDLYEFTVLKNHFGKQLGDYPTEEALRAAAEQEAPVWAGEMPDTMWKLVKHLEAWDAAGAPPDEVRIRFLPIPQEVYPGWIFSLEPTLPVMLVIALKHGETELVKYSVRQDVHLNFDYSPAWGSAYRKSSTEDVVRSDHLKASVAWTRHIMNPIRATTAFEVPQLRVARQYSAFLKRQGFSGNHSDLSPKERNLRISALVQEFGLTELRRNFPALMTISE